ncbi:MAG: hypothetical protein ACKVW3_04990 [Phycisphaerales bacterium]
MTSPLRRTVDVVAVLAGVGFFAWIGDWWLGRLAEEQVRQRVSTSVRKFEQVLSLHAASNEGPTNQRGWPVTVDPTWFETDPPRNGLVTPDRPWVEIATEDEADLRDPPIRMTIDPRHASFWYNPYQGVVRARVPVMINDKQALALYNRVNRTNLDSIYATSVPKALPLPPPEGGTGKPQTPQQAVTSASEPSASQSEKP